MDENDPDVQGTQHGNVHQDITEILACDDRPIDADHKGPLSVKRDVL